MILSSSDGESLGKEKGRIMADKIALPASYNVLLGEAGKAKKERSRVQLRTHLKIIEQLGKDIERAILKVRRE